LRSPQLAEFDAGHLARSVDYVEPHHFAGLEVDERGIIQLLGAADVGGAEANDAAGEPENSKRDPAGRGDLVLRMEEERIIIAALLPELHRVGAERPVEAAAVFRR